MGGQCAVYGTPKKGKRFATHRGALRTTPAQTVLAAGRGKGIRESYLENEGVLNGCCPGKGGWNRVENCKTKRAPSQISNKEAV